MQGDARMVVDALQRDVAAVSNGSFGHILNDARHILHSIPHWKVTFGWRESNKVAYRLARLILTLDNQVLWFEKPSDVISDFFFRIYSITI